MTRTHILLLHIALGLAGYFFRGFSGLYAVLFLAIATVQVLRTNNRSGWAHLGAAYFVGMEVWLRMTKASLPWEFGKIAVTFMLILGLAVERRMFRKPVFLLLIALLLPAVFAAEGLEFNQFRQLFTFQLGGLITLSFAAIYFFKRPFSVLQWQQLLVFMVAPILTMSIQATLRSPSLQEMRFELGANFAASGGFGPNQVSTILGLGIACIALNFMLRLPPLFSRWIDLGILGFFFMRVLLTFSRGGAVAAVLAVGMAYVIYMKDSGYSFKKLRLPALLAVVLAGLFFTVNNLTGGALVDRYKGETYATKRGFEERTLEKASSGRIDIFWTDIAMFLDNPLLGVGAGVSNTIRPDYGVRNISHMEQSRLLAEHGVLGISVLLIIILAFTGQFFRRKGEQRFVLVLFFSLSFLTMAHSATRLAMVGFCYGLGFAYMLVEEKRARNMSSNHRNPASPPATV